MSRQPPSNFVLFFYALFLLAGMAAFGLMIWRVEKKHPLDAVNAPRVEERKKALAEMRKEEARRLFSPASWLDKSNGVVRLPLADATNLFLREWQDAAAGREKLLKRLALAHPPPPKPKPEAPSPFE